MLTSVEQSKAIIEAELDKVSLEPMPRFLILLRCAAECGLKISTNAGIIEMQIRTNAYQRGPTDALHTAMETVQAIYELIDDTLNAV